ncbi:MAG: D-glycero-alpha-D-manno-heptose-1,7-bisphosphate 7-phosphatase [Promethearchaeota archaeon]
MIKRRAIFLDRDGTLIEDKGYVYKIKDFKLLSGVIKGLKLLQQHFLLFIITNQSGIGKGYYTIQDFFKFNNHLIKILKQNTIKIEKTFFCPHTDEDNCECKKPKTKFIEIITSNYQINLKDSWVIGDHPSDVMLGVNSGCKTIYLLTGHGQKHFQELHSEGINPTYIAKNFLSAVNFILKNK